jgi:hypothetical protein
MFRRKESQRARERATEYATCKDFRQIFTEDMAGLHLLAYLLTADSVKAEQCFVAGLEDSIHGNLVFKQWARAWSKRAIIQNAIKVMSPAPGQRSGVQESAPGLQNGNASDNPLVSVVTRWTTFERFVFVMSVLEGYSLRECSTLLACRDHDVISAKSQLLQRLAGEPSQAGAVSVLDKTPWTALFARTQVA